MNRSVAVILVLNKRLLNICVKQSSVQNSTAQIICWKNVFFSKPTLHISAAAKRFL